MESVIPNRARPISFPCRLLDKQTVTCPHSDSCSEALQRGNLDDHLRYHCSGTLVACQFAGAGCEYRGPSKSMNKHQNECKFREEGKRGKKRKEEDNAEISFVEVEQCPHVWQSACRVMQFV